MVTLEGARTRRVVRGALAAGVSVLYCAGGEEFGRAGVTAAAR
jgi:hypothetical protein